MNTNEIDASLLQSVDPNQLINSALAPYAGLFLIVTIGSVILTILLLIVWIMSLVRKRKVQAAIFDIQSQLHQMNEREKTRDNKLSKQPSPQLESAVPTSSAPTAED